MRIESDIQFAIAPKGKEFKLADQVSVQKDLVGNSPGKSGVVSSKPKRPEKGGGKCKKLYGARN